MQSKSLGMIETWGHVPAIVAADAGCKAANVLLAGYEEVRAGLVAILFTGDVAAVQTAVAAADLAARNVGRVVSVHVIPRPDRQVDRIAPGGPKPSRHQTGRVSDLSFSAPGGPIKGEPGQATPAGGDQPIRSREHEEGKEKRGRKSAAKRQATAKGKGGKRSKKI
jgi:ethanolamine utilization protein EutM